MDELIGSWLLDEYGIFDHDAAANTWADCLGAGGELDKQAEAEATENGSATVRSTESRLCALRESSSPIIFVSCSDQFRCELGQQTIQQHATASLRPTLQVFNRHGASTEGFAASRSTLALNKVS